MGGIADSYEADEEDRRLEADVQRAIDERWEAQLMNAKRDYAAGASFEERTMLDAYVEGRKAGRDELSIEMNPHPAGSAKATAWELGRFTALKLKMDRQ